jgi:hypothetical protein
MMNKNERMEKLNQAGINTSKYFTVDLDNGTKIHLIIDENGQPVVVNKKKDEIAEQIITDGYVRNTKLHRRFVMAQMFQMLNYVSYDGYEEGFHACLRNRYGYHYTLTMMLEEVRVLSKLEVRDIESFHERSSFFTKNVIVDVLCDYVEKLQNYVDSLPTKHCKGIPYKRIKGENIFVDDLGKKLYRPMLGKIKFIQLSRSYNELYRHLSGFMRDVIKLPYNTTKSKVWIDTYKGEGAYYTLKNLVMFHECGIKVDKFDVKYGVSAVAFLEDRLDEYKGEGWRMFALMKKVIADNKFNFNERMKEIYSDK